MLPATQIKAIFFGICSIFHGGKDFDDKIQTLEIESDFLGVIIEDVKQQSFSANTKRVKKRKRTDQDRDLWVSHANQVLTEAQHDITWFRKYRFFILPSQMATQVQEKIEAVKAFQKQGALHLGCDATHITASSRTSYIPAKELIGQVASAHLQMLQGLVQDPRVGRIAILGKPGMGKTILMKCLYNWTLNLGETFKFILWVTLPDQFNIMEVQDAIAKELGCDLSSEDDLMTRAGKLGNVWADLDSFVLFLDGVSEGFSLEQLGIRIPTEGSTRKVIVTTNSNLVFDKLRCTNKVELGPLPDEDAYQLFLQDALLDAESASSLDGLPRVLAELCHGEPRSIENQAVKMRGITDTSEWRHEAQVMKNVSKCRPFEIVTTELPRSRKRLKMEVVLQSSFPAE